jgi:hypothetical protein
VLARTAALSLPSDPIPLKFQYPLWILRVEGREKADPSSSIQKFMIVDDQHALVAETSDYDSAYELIRLANCAYKFFDEIGAAIAQPKHVLSTTTPYNLRWAKAHCRIPDTGG